MEKIIKLLIFAIWGIVSTVYAADQTASCCWQDVDKETLQKETTNNLWRDQDPKVLSQKSKFPEKYRLLTLDIVKLDNLLSQTPLESAKAFKETNVILPLPLPNGTFKNIKVVESPMMAGELAAKFPEIKTYQGVGLDDATATARLSRTPSGFRAIILLVEGTVYVEPYSRKNMTGYYVSYFKRDYDNYWGKTFKEEPPIDYKKNR